MSETMMSDDGDWVEHANDELTGDQSFDDEAAQAEGATQAPRELDEE